MKSLAAICLLSITLCGCGTFTVQRAGEDRFYVEHVRTGWAIDKATEHCARDGKKMETIEVVSVAYGRNASIMFRCK